MNYLRGAVSVISVPYQYLYKDINPSTLTGAIDVIVIKRPADNGDSELVCSPFHVRFGKWQVLRPSEKKVDVSVNGNPIPFQMKIGEAGEAFFVFETDEDIPDDLMTSPILRPSSPSTETNGPVEDAVKPTGMKGDAKEPEFLDLDASSEPQQREHLLHRPEEDDLLTPQPKYINPYTNAPSLSSSLPASSLHSLHELSHASPAVTRTRRRSITTHSVEEALEVARAQLPEPHITYQKDITLDREGYHIHGRDASDATIRDSLDNDRSGASTPQPSRSPSPDGSPQTSQGTPFPVMRATSEPPPDVEDETNKHDVINPVQEYSWDWGAFPQPSAKPAYLGTGTESAGNTWAPKGRRKLRRRIDPGSLQPDERKYGMEDDEKFLFPSIDPKEAEPNGFGAGGKLLPSKSDPSKLIVAIEGRKIEFEVSLVPALDTNPNLFNGLDEVSAQQEFDDGKIDYHKLLEEEDLVDDHRLVILWVGDLYITKKDSSPLMEALRLWRDAARQEKAQGVPTRPTSPMSESELDEEYQGREREPQERQAHGRSKSLPPEKVAAPSAKPASSSWTQWWRGRSKVEPLRPELRETSSLPAPTALVSSSTSGLQRHPSDESLVVESAPAPSTPNNASPSPAPVAATAIEPGNRKKYAKTLRLTSDQLKSLNLHSGPNTITFSLASSGTIACTARIFVWDHTDFIVISDIDGTITKSDALGHVFTMIGRDWTHLGVAKLYTDIVRNGYKIMYLTSRAIGQADSTRDYLKNIKQDHYQLPEGPVIMSPDRLMASLHREVIMRKPEVFKMACLRDIRRLFGEASRNPFYAGFGNRITDALSYRSVDVPSDRIFTIDSTGEVKMELLELAGYKSSYIHMTDLVDQMFPPIHRKWVPAYTDFNYWKLPVQKFDLPDLSPPSPSLSVRSDLSNQSALARIRNFSLGGSSISRQSSLPPPARQTAMAKDEEGEERTSALRQMSSFERLGSALSNLTSASPRTSSPDPYASEAVTSDSEDEDVSDPHGTHKHTRRRSMTSMPGSLDDMDFDFDEEEHGYDNQDEGVQEANDEMLDEDLLAAETMQSVPFL